MFSLITEVFINIHEYANEMIFIGPLDEITYQIVSLIILKLATIVVRRCFWAELRLFMFFMILFNF